MLWKKFAHLGLFLICEKLTQILDAWMHKGPKSTLRFVLNAGILQGARHIDEFYWEEDGSDTIWSYRLVWERCLGLGSIRVYIA
jgi:hypothetical protein